MTSKLTLDDLRGLSEEQARRLYQSGEEAVVWALLQLSAMARSSPDGKADDPSTPSAMRPPYEKTNTGAKRRKKPGRKPGHRGARRGPPLNIERRQEHVLERCPDCGGPVSSPRSRRTRVTEDIEHTRAVATDHVIASHYCAVCKKRVEPVVTSALPRATVGNRTAALTSWLHYGLGNSVSQVVEVLNSLFHFPVSPGGLTQMWQRMAGLIEPWYQQIAEEAKGSAVLNIDETGWRVDGVTHWLWCFTSPELSYYHIDASRGGRVLTETLGEVFAGTVVCDFFSAYNAIAADRRQRCLAHFLREIKRVSLNDRSDQWLVFAPIFKRLLRDALRLGRRADRDAPDFVSKRRRLYKRLDALCDGLYDPPNAARLIKRFARHRDELFSFLHDPAIPPDNNRAERELRPAIIARKNSFHNMSDPGARTQAILMTVYRTLKLRGLDPLETIADAMAVEIAGGQLPALPGKRGP